jgi:hypothetical protein
VPDCRIGDPSPPGQGTAPACGVCAQYGEPAPVGRITKKSLVELSGLAASRRSPGVLYGHNDSGDAARFFALREGGAVLGQFLLAGVAAIDWEDIALGPCAAGTCVFLGDIGDNKRERVSYAIYAVAEPALAGVDPAAKTPVAFEARRFTYPDGPHNAEALLVHPITGQIHVITKEKSGLSVVFRLPAPSGSAPVLAERVGDLVVPAGGNREITAGSVHPCASRILVRTYDRAFELEAPAGAPFEAVFSAPLRAVPVPSRQDEPQGEAITYAPDGRGYLTSTEGKAALIHRVGCRAGD